MSSKNVVISKKLHKELLEDKARVDYLEKLGKRGRVKLLGTDFNFPIPKDPVRHLLDTYRLNDKDF